MFSHDGANGLESKTTHMFRPFRQVAAPGEVCRLRLRRVFIDTVEYKAVKSLRKPNDRLTGLWFVSCKMTNHKPVILWPRCGACLAVLWDDTSVNIKICVLRLGAEDAKDVVDRVSGYASRVEFRRIAISEEVFPWRVQPQFVVDLRLFLGFGERVLAQLAVLTYLFLQTSRRQVSKPRTADD